MIFYNSKLQKMVHTVYTKTKVYFSLLHVAVRSKSKIYPINRKLLY